MHFFKRFVPFLGNPLVQDEAILENLGGGESGYRASCGDARRGVEEGCNMRRCSIRFGGPEQVDEIDRNQSQIRPSNTNLLPLSRGPLVNYTSSYIFLNLVEVFFLSVHVYENICEPCFCYKRNK